MGQIGNIKEITVTSGQITCVVDIANGGEKTATIFGLAGVDVYPMPGDEVMIDYCSGEWVVNAVFRDAETEQGETIIYSRDSDGAVVASVHCKANGDTVINEGDRSAVGFEDLKTAFDQLKSDFDALVTAYNSHIHITTATVTPGVVGVISPTVSTGSPTTADIDPAESETVKVP